jgi:PAS domain S-box-containing protein
MASEMKTLGQDVDVDELLARLEEAEATLQAIREGEVDALIVRGPAGDSVYTLRSAEEPYQLIVEQMREGALTIDRTGIIVYCNSAFAEMIGIERSSVLGMRLQEFLVEAPESSVQSLLQPAGCQDQTLHVKSAQGRVVTLHVSSAPLGDAHCLVASNLTYQQSWARMAAVVSASEDAIFGLSPECLVDSWNEGAQRLFGRAPDDVLGQTVEALFPDSEASKIGHALNRVRADEATRIEVPVQRPDGNFAQLVLSLSPVRNRDGDLIAVSVVGHDITARLEAERVLRDREQLLRLQKERLELEDRRKDEFLAVLGHELRNPLAPLSTGLALLEGAGSRPDLTDSVHAMMKRQISHLVRLVDDLLDVGRISSGKIQLQTSRLDLREVVEASIEATKPLIMEQGQRLHVQQTEHELPIDGDFQRLMQVVGNLLGNAAKYTERGGTIWVRTAHDVDHAVLQITDTGLGIPPEKLGDLFQMFSQIAEHRSSTPRAGLGIGLALSRQLVMRHGGTIEASSKGLGHGSEFTVRLPLVETAASTAAHPPLERRKRQASRRVLIVDDNRDAAETLRIMLELEGHEAVAVYDGAAALETVKSFGPEVVVLDIGLPQLNGYEVARRIRAEDTDVTLFALSGWGQREDKQRARNAGFDEHLTKPVDPSLISALIAASRAVASGAAE